MPSATGEFRGHLSELDGIRAVAVLLVLVFHFAPRSAPVLWRFIPAGWIGVDMFFVLSGFLITAILLRTRQRPDYYRTFYVRRALRIFPLYYFVLASIFLAMLVWNHGTAYRAFTSGWGSPAWYWLYAANIKYALINQWPTAAAPLIPLWSLQIEEHFYLVFPFVVRRLPAKTLLRALLIVITASPLLRFLLWRWDPSNSYLQYTLTPCRLDGLAFGALVALRIDTLRALDKRIVALLALCTLGIAYGSYVWLGHNDRLEPFSRIFSYSLFSAAFACILLWVILFRGSWTTRWLNAWPVQFLGKISYGIYMLQFPAAAILAVVLANTSIWRSGMGRFAAVVAMTVLLATLSWYALERPILKLKDWYAPSGSAARYSGLGRAPDEERTAGTATAPTD